MGYVGWSRLGSGAAILSVVATFAGFGVHGGLPGAATAEAVMAYASGVNAVQSAVGNYLELLGYVLLLPFAALLYVLGARSRQPAAWAAVVGFGAAVAYVAVSAMGIAAQQAMVDWAKSGADTKSVLGIYILDEYAFLLSFELAALFLLGAGFALYSGGEQRLVGGSAVAVGAIVFVGGLAGIAAPDSSVAQAVFVVLSLWTLAAGVLLLVRPPLPGAGTRTEPEAG